MAEAERRATVSGDGTATVWERPHLLVMTLPLRAAEATLDLGLAKLRASRDEAAGWLRRLGAARVEPGEPHFADQVVKDPLAAARAIAAAGRGRRASAPPAGVGVRQVLTAVWDIAGKPAEEVLGLADRLRFEAAAVADPPAPADDPPRAWADPEDQVRAVMAQLHAAAGDEPADAAGFLFVARPDDARVDAARAEAFAQARGAADRLARAAGGRVGRLVYVTGSVGGSAARGHNRLMDQQKWLARLDDSTYRLGPHEEVSEDARAAEFAVRVNASYELE